MNFSRYVCIMLCVFDVDIINIGAKLNLLYSNCCLYKYSTVLHLFSG